ncbi:hypothetical protein MMOR_38670 [Mycolicibacterium moriokaense]|uniref:Uncharacterized protein n=1 Tax=Mycolicibacterium moriokaense TaxID=39691 RepID=A0AAD1HEP4_9MYCO|nr:hypothetical protein MMOR_38670 [Mycolicibacterium moriokaense]
MEHRDDPVAQLVVAQRFTDDVPFLLIPGANRHHSEIAGAGRPESDVACDIDGGSAHVIDGK